MRIARQNRPPGHSKEAQRPKNPATVAQNGRIPRCARNDKCARNDGRAHLALCLLLGLLALGCQPEPSALPDAISAAAERGPFKLVVEARPKKVWIGDPITVELRVHTPADHLVRFPELDEIDNLDARDVQTSDPRPAADGGLDWRQTFTIEPLRSGELEIPPLVVRYARQPAEPDADAGYENELVADSLKLTVLSALTTQDSVHQPRDITGTLLPPKPPLSPWKTGLIAGAVIGAVAGGYAAYRAIRKRRLRPPPPILPEVWALAALAELEQVDWFERGRVRECYYRLTEIVRSYIERKFALAAPEMTTQEFLNTLARDRGALPYEPERLRAFLETCDIVKYAAYSPRRADADEALRSARVFVSATANTASRSGGQAA